MGPTPQVAIVGAGMAGLNAARVLAHHGVSVEILEATERIGGRVHTVHHEGSDLAVELGPEFVHGRPDVTLALANQAGLAIEPIYDTHYIHDDHRLVEIGDIWTRFGALLGTAPEPVRDESALAFFRHARLAGRDARMFTRLVEGFYAAPLDDISIASVAEDASGVGDEPPQSRIRGGYGRLVTWLGSQLTRAGVAIRHDCVATAIDWGSTQVRIDCRRGGRAHTVHADRAIVTLPLGVLQSAGEGGVRFSPPLGDHAAAIAQLAMGQVVKIVLCLREPVWQKLAPNELAFAHGDDTSFLAFWLRAGRTSAQLTAWAGGPHAIALGQLSAEQLADRAIDELARTIGTPRARIAAAVRHYHFYDFATDPFVRGAYSYTRVGGHTAAEQLSRPLGERLFFAGEATDAAHEGTVAGALASGARAAQQVLATLERT